MDPVLTVCSVPTEAIRNAIVAPLAEFNAENGYPPDPDSLAITLTDPNDQIVGGLWGITAYDWLFIDFLVVPSGLRARGIGTKLMTAAESVAVERGCVGVWLTTFTFQARGFYEKLGYEVFASLDRSPRDNVRLFLRKHLQG